MFDDETRSNLIGNTKVSFNDHYKLFEKRCLAESKEFIADSENDDFTDSKIKMAVFDVIKYVIRDRTLHQGLRVDDRGMTDIRPLFMQLDIAPRTHGS